MNMWKKYYVSFLVTRKIKYYKKNYSQSKYNFSIINNDTKEKRNWEKSPNDKKSYFLLWTDGCCTFLGYFKFNYFENISSVYVSLLIFYSKYSKRRNYRFSKITYVNILAVFWIFICLIYFCPCFYILFNILGNKKRQSNFMLSSCFLVFFYHFHLRFTLHIFNKTTTKKTFIVYLKYYMFKTLWHLAIAK